MNTCKPSYQPEYGVIIHNECESLNPSMFYPWFGQWPLTSSCNMLIYSTSAELHIIYSK